MNLLAISHRITVLLTKYVLPQDNRCNDIRSLTGPIDYQMHFVSHMILWLLWHFGQKHQKFRINSYLVIRNHKGAFVIFVKRNSRTLTAQTLIFKNDNRKLLTFLRSSYCSCQGDVSCHQSR